MSHTEILTAIYTKISTIPNIGTVLYPNRKYPNSTMTVLPDSYVQVYVMPVPSATATFDGGITQSGLIQCDCVIKVDIGEIKAAQMADIILSALKNGTVISGNLRVNKPPYASGGIVVGNGTYKIPVTIQYRDIAC